MDGITLFLCRERRSRARAPLAGAAADGLAIQDAVADGPASRRRDVLSSSSVRVSALISCAFSFGVVIRYQVVELLFSGRRTTQNSAFVDGAFTDLTAACVSLSQNRGHVAFTAQLSVIVSLTGQIWWGSSSAQSLLIFYNALKSCYANFCRFWYPPDYPYQQAFYNSQMLQHYYSQLYGTTSSPAGPPYQYMGYMPGGSGPRTGFSPMQQHARPFFQQPTAQMEGSFPPGPSLPPNFRLQLPPHAVSRQPDDTSGPQSNQPSPANEVTSTDNQEASRPITSNSDPNTSN
ncbi:hypothetical protein EJB05_20098, partial [Eragrostis curvula]